MMIDIEVTRNGQKGLVSNAECNRKMQKWIQMQYKLPQSLLHMNLRQVASYPLKMSTGRSNEIH